MKKQCVMRSVKFALSVAAVAALLGSSPATRDWSITTAHAAPQRVLVVNGETRPIPVTPGNEIFQQQITVSVNSGSLSGNNTFQVPAGTRLVLENIAGKGATLGANVVEVSQADADAIMIPTTVNATWVWSGTTPTKVVFNAGTVTVSVRRPSTGGASVSNNFITLTGYLVPSD